MMINNIIAMKLYQQSNMINKVHKTVKYMLSQARQIIREKHKLPINSKKSISFLLQLSPTIQHSSNHIQLNKQQFSIDRYRQIKNKQRPVSLASSSQHPQNKFTIKEQTISYQKLQLRKPTFLNREEAELIQDSRKMIYRHGEKRQNQSILPPLIRRLKDKRIKQAEGNKYFSISVEALEALEELNSSKIKRFKTVQSTNSTNLLSYLQKNKQKNNPFKLKRRQKLKQFIRKKDIECQPWQNHQQQTDLMYQI